MTRYASTTWSVPHDAIVQSDFCVRALARDDIAEVKQLYTDGLLPGQTSADPMELDAVKSCLASLRQRIWVAEAGGMIIGTLALAEVGRDVAQLRWLRVAPPWQEGHEVAKQLISAAADHARDMDFLKLTLHVPASAQSIAAAYFRLLGFEFSRALTGDDRHMLEFYLNLYELPELRRDMRPRRPR